MPWDSMTSCNLMRRESKSSTSVSFVFTRTFSIRTSRRGCEEIWSIFQRTRHSVCCLKAIDASRTFVLIQFCKAGNGGQWCRRSFVPNLVESVFVGKQVQNNQTHAGRHIHTLGLYILCTLVLRLDRMIPNSEWETTAWHLKVKRKSRSKPHQQNRRQQFNPRLEPTKQTPSTQQESTVQTKQVRLHGVRGVSSLAGDPLAPSGPLFKFKNGWSFKSLQTGHTHTHTHTDDTHTHTLSHTHTRARKHKQTHLHAMQWKKSRSLTETEQPKEPFLQALRVLCERVWPDWGVRAAYLETEVSSQVRIVSWGKVMHYQCSGARLEPMADLINLLMRKRDVEASAGPSSSAACNTTMVNQTVTVSTVHQIKRPSGSM